MRFTHRLRFACFTAASGVVLTATLAATDPDPRYTSWLTAPSGTYARLYTSTAAQTSGSAVTTWSRGQGTQSTPTYAGFTQISYSASWVYLRGSGLGFHPMGPWYLNAANTQDFPNFPANTGVLYRIPRTPTVPTTKTLTNTGAIGYFVDGVAMFDYTDTFSYSTGNGTDASPVAGIGRGDGVWNRDAYINEGETFDPAFAHQAGSQYHYHANTPALRYQLNDHVDYNSTTRTYQESTTPVTQHSPIVGWVRDGYPVYGPYGYASANDPASGVRRMISGYIKRDGTHGTTHLSSTGRTTLPAWAATAQNRSASLASNVSGPAVNSTYPLGHFLEDYDFWGDQSGTQGTDFDLDQFNGRFCVTPEFPQGTYAYFLSIESDGTPKYPYIVGRWFYGSPTGAAVTSISETVTEFVRGAPSAALQLSAAASGSRVNVSWNSIEGATYTVDTSTDQGTWTTQSSSVASAGLSTSFVAPVAKYYRVTLSAIAAYDTDGTTGTAVGSTGTVAYDDPASGVAPTITTPPASLTIDAGAAATFTVTASGDSPFTYQWFKDGAAIINATSASYTVAAAATVDTGSYTVSVANATGSAVSDAAHLTVNGSTSVAPTTRVINISTRTQVGGEAGTPVIGLVIGGAGSKSVLVRAVGPTLASFNVTGTLADPQLNVVRSSDGTTVASNDNWGNAANASTLNTTSAALGAFALTTGSADAAWLGALTAGAYTAPLLDDRGSGIVLLETYDAGSPADTAQLLNASTRAWVGQGDAVLVAGFVIEGEGTQKVLLRGVGPTLASYQVSGYVPDPTIKLVRDGATLATNDDWHLAANAASIATAATTVGAFALNPSSGDSALLLNLSAGAYTLVISGVGDTTGTALAEIYLVP